MILIEMRKRWSEPRAEHLSEERRERMAVAWARLRLIDKYEAEFAKQKKTVSIWRGDAKPDDYPAPEVRLSDFDRDEIVRVVEQLPERQREVVKMLMFEGMTQRDVAKVLGVSQPAVSATFDRARETLTRLLQPFAGAIQ